MKFRARSRVSVSSSSGSIIPINRYISATTARRCGSFPNKGMCPVSPYYPLLRAGSDHRRRALPTSAVPLRFESLGVELRPSVSRGDVRGAGERTAGSAVGVGGVPQVVRTDNLSVATHELRDSRGRALNARYEAVLAHYGVKSTRINPRSSHENGVVEQGHRRLKDAIAPPLTDRSDDSASGTRRRPVGPR